MFILYACLLPNLILHKVSETGNFNTSERFTESMLDTTPPGICLGHLLSDVLMGRAVNAMSEINVTKHFSAVVVLLLSFCCLLPAVVFFLLLTSSALFFVFLLDK